MDDPTRPPAPKGVNDYRYDRHRYAGDGTDSMRIGLLEHRQAAADHQQREFEAEVRQGFADIREASSRDNRETREEFSRQFKDLTDNLRGSQDRWRMTPGNVAALVSVVAAFAVGLTWLIDNGDTSVRNDLEDKITSIADADARRAAGVDADFSRVASAVSTNSENVTALSNQLAGLRTETAANTEFVERYLFDAKVPETLAKHSVRLEALQGVEAQQLDALVELERRVAVVESDAERDRESLEVDDRWRTRTNLQRDELAWWRSRYGEKLPFLLPGGGPVDSAAPGAAAPTE